ncbi:protein fem-1 homolog B [Daktulosphaira vitifoliae]|uniref:protein fem-1 homolog B n=1 Tax=Daktulosphaira vitifoliae TaxID=58002 RepID=UPI0021AAD474|nr:protein fem-1 homolog B [Daktulosphaira vitifoliae]
MTFSNGFKTLAPYKFNIKEELRISVKKGLEVHFFKALSQFESDTINDIINETYTDNDNQVKTLLIEAAINGQIKIIKHLLNKFKVNLNVEGKVKHFGSMVEGATALWCAAGSGHLEIVKILLENGAFVDYCTKTKSTPLRAACYLGRLDIVKSLVENGANVNATNIFNSTCLMIASYRGHKNVVKFLLENGADVNQQTNCGATAMHFAAQADHLKIIQMLLAYNAKHLKNEHSLTPILVAAERTHFVLVYYLLDALHLSREEKIEAEELLGASFLNDKDTYDNHLGFTILMHSMEMRYNMDPVIPKETYVKVEAYNNRIECQTVQDLAYIKDDLESLHYESLIIRERILGIKNADLLQSIIYRGAVYADSYNFTPCMKLWLHAMKIAQDNQTSIHKDLLRFAQVFCQMIKANISIQLIDLKKVLEATTEELKRNKTKLINNSSEEDRKVIEIDYFGNILSTLGLIIITSIILVQNNNLEDPLKGEILKIIVEINKLKVRTSKGQSLLHLCLNYDTNVDNLFTNGICCFPNYPTMKLLIYCGANVNAIDNNRNTPLHYLDKFISDFPHIPHTSNHLDTKKMVMELLDSGAHTDFINNRGVCPHTGFLNTVFKLTNNNPMSLKCLAAREVRKNIPREYYLKQLPIELKDFTDLHGVDD